jgi:dTDP-4-amino-4,6-dideoxygalactose transaminase
MTDIQAAVGREQLKRLPELLRRRRGYAAAYAETLADVAGLRLPKEPAWARSNWQSFCVRLPQGLGQRAFMQRLLDAGVSTRRGIMCCHREAPYSGARQVGSLRTSEAAQDHGVLLPLFAQMTDSELSQVSVATREACLSAARHDE